jgi:hypothetical protein
MDMTTLKAATLVAGMVCHDTPDLLRVLADRFGEPVVATGKAASGMQLFITANGESGTWTMVYAGEPPAAVGCIVMHGVDWREVGPPQPTIPKAPAPPAKNKGR